MEKETQARIIVIDTLLAFLLAREAIHSNTDMRVLHQALVRQLSDAMPSPEMASVAEASLDGIYSMASAMVSRMSRSEPEE